MQSQCQGLRPQCLRMAAQRITYILADGLACYGNAESVQSFPAMLRLGQQAAVSTRNNNGLDASFSNVVEAAIGRLLF